MIDDDNVASLGLEPCDAGGGSGAAIDRQDQLPSMPFKAVLDGHLAQAISLVQPVWQIGVDLASEHREHFDQDCGGAYSVDVIIAKDHDWLGALAGIKK